MTDQTTTEAQELQALLDTEFEGPDRTPTPLGTSDTIRGLVWFAGQMSEYCLRRMNAVPPKYRVDSRRAEREWGRCVHAVDRCRNASSREIALAEVRSALTHARGLHDAAVVDRDAVHKRLAKLTTDDGERR